MTEGCYRVSADPINQFAVVSYIPDRLGDFITRLRQDLVAGCVAQSHISILTPRPLPTDPATAEIDLRAKSLGFSAFELEITGIRVFESTSVIFADLGLGREHFITMHDALNTGVLAFQEPFAYHPHVTLAQGFDPATLKERQEMAVRRWAEAPARLTSIDNLTFVQNTSTNRWIDLAQHELRGAMASSF